MVASGVVVQEYLVVLLLEEQVRLVPEPDLAELHLQILEAHQLPDHDVDEGFQVQHHFLAVDRSESVEAESAHSGLAQQSPAGHALLLFPAQQPLLFPAQQPLLLSCRHAQLAHSGGVVVDSVVRAPVAGRGGQNQLEVVLAIESEDADHLVALASLVVAH